MENLNGQTKTTVNQLRELEAENRSLREENRQLQADKAAAKLKLEQQQAMEKNYAQSQSRFQTIFYESKLGNKIIGPDLKIIQINAALMAILGYSEKEMVGSIITEFAHPDFVHDWQELQENLWSKQIPSFQIETCLVKKDGSILWCQVTSILIPDQDGTLGYTIVEDINKRKRLELELQKLYDNQETIMHMIVHDLKNYLFNIKLLNELMQENPQALPGEGKDSNFNLIQQTSNNCDQALAIIDDILLIGRLESVEEIFEKRDLVTFVQKQLANLRIDARKKGIQINFHYLEEPVYARIIPNKFKRVLENLLTNAIKFTPAGGKVTITLKKEGKKALLQVSDTGIGVPEHLQGSIFQKFTQANRVGTAGEPTTGLGLYIVKQIVEKHKGKIWLESKENEGSSFFIQLH